MGPVLLSLYKMMKLLLIVMLVVSATSRSKLFHACDCEYFSGGCRITTAVDTIVDHFHIPMVAPMACHCTYHGFWTCSGEPRLCRDENLDSCTTPGTDLEHCLQGQGDCG